MNESRMGELGIPELRPPNWRRTFMVRCKEKEISIPNRITIKLKGFYICLITN